MDGWISCLHIFCAEPVFLPNNILQSIHFYLILQILDAFSNCVLSPNKESTVVLFFLVTGVSIFFTVNVHG
ncbi:hypothetical protein SLEP1_g12929 [Rubroshorea leprosula]|uniref:Uncharacterized protein n=1 Tax=Rubroshorea leprosula TaxID=152421 RepID=A0AAV5INJ4_9ROSI|nr:hypothetical protein SLEP1_g12929 [Rubroshorea leprosula]